MKRLLLPTFLLLLLFGIGFPARPPAVAQATDADEMKKLRDRVDALEKIVLQDPMHPKQPILARLMVLEDQVKQLPKVGEAAAKMDVKDTELLRKTLAQLQKDSIQLDKRLTAAEQQLQHGGRAGGDNTLRELKRAIDQLDRVVDDLAERVKQLERKP